VKPATLLLLGVSYGALVSLMSKIKGTRTLATSPRLPFCLANLLHSLSEEDDVVLQ
jgi:hypothetical protein